MPESASSPNVTWPWSSNAAAYSETGYGHAGGGNGELRPAVDSGQRVDSDIGGEPAATGTGFLLVVRANANGVAPPGPALTPERVSG